MITLKLEKKTKKTGSNHQITNLITRLTCINLFSYKIKSNEKLRNYGVVLCYDRNLPLRYVHI